MKPVAVYLRVSSDDQSHESQRSIVLRWLEAEGIEPAKVQWYEDVESGSVAVRPQLERLKADVRKRLRKTVVVYALDRLSRDFFDGVELLGLWLKAGCRVASATEPLDLAGELGQALAGVLFALAAIERKKIKARQHAGIALAKVAGKYAGRKPGATAGGVAAGKPARARELAGRGLSAPEIATALGVSERTAFRYLAASDLT